MQVDIATLVAKQKEDEEEQENKAQQLDLFEGVFKRLYNNPNGYKQIFLSVHSFNHCQNDDCHPRHLLTTGTEKTYYNKKYASIANKSDWIIFEIINNVNNNNDNNKYYKVSKW